MELTLKNLTLKKEKTYFALALVISIIVWFVLTISIVGLLYALFFVVMLWFTNGLFVAYLKSESVLINESQLPELFTTYKELCKQLELTKIPELYVIQSGGLLNAFATRHAGRKFVVLYSDIIESYNQTSGEIKFLLGHEIGHIKCRHILKRLFLFPGLIFPLLGSAYSRACESSCDRYGAFVAKDVNGALKAIMVLSGGKHIGKDMSPESFAEQYKKHRGFFISWHELISGYPTLSQRMANLIAVRDNKPLPNHSRNPFAYLFALFSFGGSASGRGNMFITFFIIAMLAAIAIPNLLRARLSANDAVAKATLNSMSGIVQNYVKTHGSFPTSVNELEGYISTFSFKTYCQKTVSGYSYECSFLEDDFEFKAIPVEIGVSGSSICIANKNGSACDILNNKE